MSNATPPPHEWDGSGPLYLHLRVLDHQIVGPDGELLGNVDDLELVDLDDGGLAVRGILTGAGALAGRQPGRVGDWLGAIWRRLHLQAHPRPRVLPISHVTAISSALVVDAAGGRALAHDADLEQWLRRYVVSRLPGAGTAQSAVDPGTPTRELAASSHLAARLLRGRVVDAKGGELGDVLEVCVESVAGPGNRPDLQLSALVYGRHHLGANLGYTVDPRLGPWLVGALVRARHRDDRRVPWTHVSRVDWSVEPPLVTLAEGAHPRHPHDLDRRVLER